MCRERKQDHITCFQVVLFFLKEKGTFFPGSTNFYDLLEGFVMQSTWER